MRSPKDSFERIITSVPQNATAARVMGRGTHYEPVVEMSSHEHWDLPPPMKAFSSDLVGRKFGRLTVLGLSVDQNPKKNARWVVRCVCGHYEIRKAKAIRNPANTDDCCQNCAHLRKVKSRYARLGSKSVEEFSAQKEGQ